MRSINVEREWKTTAGYPARVILTDMGHRCGYVGLPISHPLYSINYNAVHPIAAVEWERVKSGTIGKRGIIDLVCAAGRDASDQRIGIIFDVHGGITYSGRMRDADGWWFGFDAAHCDDHDDPKSADYMANECESLASQLADISSRYQPVQDIADAMLEARKA